MPAAAEDVQPVEYTRSSAGRRMDKVAVGRAVRRIHFRFRCTGTKVGTGIGTALRTAPIPGLESGVIFLYKS